MRIRRAVFETVVECAEEDGEVGVIKVHAVLQGHDSDSRHCSQRLCQLLSIPRVAGFACNDAFAFLAQRSAVLDPGLAQRVRLRVRSCAVSGSLWIIDSQSAPCTLRSAREYHPSVIPYSSRFVFVLAVLALRVFLQPSAHVLLCFIRQTHVSGGINGSHTSIGRLQKSSKNTSWKFGSCAGVLAARRMPSPHSVYSRFAATSRGESGPSKNFRAIQADCSPIPPRPPGCGEFVSPPHRERADEAFNAEQRQRAFE